MQFRETDKTLSSLKYSSALRKSVQNGSIRFLYSSSVISRSSMLNLKVLTCMSDGPSPHKQTPWHTEVKQRLSFPGSSLLIIKNLQANFYLC